MASPDEIKRQNPSAGDEWMKRSTEQIIRVIEVTVRGAKTFILIGKHLSGIPDDEFYSEIELSDWLLLTQDAYLYNTGC